MSDAEGRAEIISAAGQGTSVVLTWDPPDPVGGPAADPLDWARRMIPGPVPIFTGLMLPILVLIDLVGLSLRWQDMRWQAAAVVTFGGFAGLAVLCARYLSQMRLTRRAAAGLAVANTILAAVGSLAVAPGTTDSSAYWVGGVSGIAVAAIYFVRGPVSGFIALDMAALTAGLQVTGGAMSLGIWVAVLAGPPITTGVAAAMLAAFRSLSSRTESQLVRYRDQVRLQARTEAIGASTAPPLNTRGVSRGLCSRRWCRVSGRIRRCGRARR